MVAKMFRTKFKIFFFAFFWWEKKNLKVFWHPFGGIFSSFPNDNFHLIKKTVEQAIIETHFKQRKERKEGCRHSSVDASAPTIMPPGVRVASTTSTLLSFLDKFVCFAKRAKINKKGRVWTILLKLNDRKRY